MGDLYKRRCGGFSHVPAFLYAAPIHIDILFNPTIGTI